MSTNTSRRIQLGIMVLCFVPLGCTLATTALRAFGVEVSDEAIAAAQRADAEGWSAVEQIIGGLLGLGVIAGGAKGTQVAVRRRRAKKQAEQRAPVVD